jgi:estrogen-related receptor beta like 1
MDEGEDGGEVNLGPAMGPVYEMWENALEKLKILHYESAFCSKGRRPLSRVHFVYPGSNPGVQFDEFVDVCAWLCGQISRDDMFKRDQFDDPNTVVNKLLLVLRGQGFNLSFPTQKLKTAHGEAVCSVLEFLADKALAAKRFKWGTPSYSETAGDNDQQMQMDDDGGDGDIEDEAAGVVDDDLVYEEAARNEAAELSMDTSAHNILQALVDPVEWKTELERVGPKLKVNPSLAANEWRAHVDQTIASKGHIDKVLSETRGDLQVMNK